MNENINLCEILKDCPKGTELYSYMHGKVKFLRIDEDCPNPISVTTEILGAAEFTATFTSEGKYLDITDGICLLVPSKDQPDWSKWQCPKPKFDPKTLKTFDKVLVRLKLDKDYIWMPNIFSYHYNNLYYTISGYFYNYILPYNEDTKHLVGKMEDAPEYYRYWES